MQKIDWWLGSLIVCTVFSAWIAYSANDMVSAVFAGAGTIAIFYHYMLEKYKKLIGVYDYLLNSAIDELEQRPAKVDDQMTSNNSGSTP